MKMACYTDLMEQYEDAMFSVMMDEIMSEEGACDMQAGQVFIANGWQKPAGFCDSAWESLSPFVMTLAHGGENFYDGWMKNKRSAMISCNDGLRPVSFLIETLDMDAEP